MFFRAGIQPVFALVSDAVQVNGKHLFSVTQLIVVRGSILRVAVGSVPDLSAYATKTSIPLEAMGRLAR